MNPSDPLRTRTAETCIPPHAPEPEPASPVDPRTELLPAQLDTAAVGFARERERVLLRLGHSAYVRRLRRAMIFGLGVWLSAGLLDLFVTRVAHEGSLRTFFTARAIGVLVLTAVLWRLSRAPEPSARVVWSLDLLSYTTIAACISINSIEYRGIDSPYGAGVLVVLLARGATTLAPWQQGAWLFAPPALAHPVILLVSSLFDERIAAQLSNPQALGGFIALSFMIVVSWILVVMGGHFAWRLRREAVETRNIGRYKLERRLGSGGMGDVWAAFDLTLRQRVALKTVSGHRPGSGSLLRLEREVRALAELTHPNTVRVFDYGATDDGLWYYAMELLHGKNLRELVALEGPLSGDRLSSIARQVLRALGEAHGKGIIHRDIKPENVFVAELGGEVDVVKLLDFGIARTSGDTQLTNTGFVAGTPAYMAPETIVGRPADVRSDIYSFGATLHYALTGHLPFPDEDVMALFAAHLNRPLSPLTSLGATPIPAALERVVHRCLEKDPSRRYSSTRELLDALGPLGTERGELAGQGASDSSRHG
jgi:eukaryotic-like serine/threonine-protein kinase